MVRKKKKEWMTYKENGKTFMICKVCQSEYCEVDTGIRAVTCSGCVIKKTLALKPMDEFFAKKHKKTGRPAGWHWMAEFVDKDGKVYHKGKEQPELKGTLPPTKVKPPKKRKKLTADQKLHRDIKSWNKRKKARRTK
tara:strand:- start:18 stop:428 length:411 start_codon:yes stop_codon:yes gene_type:complete